MPIGGQATEVCDTWPVRCLTYGYLSSRRASPPLDQYQIVLLIDIEAHVCEQLAQGCYLKAQSQESNPRLSESQVQRPIHYATRPHSQYNNQQQQPFNSRLSMTTRVGRYQKKHSPAHTHPGQRTSFITFLHLQWSMASSLFSLHA